MLLQVGNPVDWAQFGLAGLVIFALFSVLIIVGKLTIDKMAATTIEVSKNNDILAARHHDERKEWRMSDMEARRIHTETLREIALDHQTTMSEVRNELRGLSEAVLKQVNR